MWVLPQHRADDDSDDVDAETDVANDNDDDCQHVGVLHAVVHFDSLTMWQQQQQQQ